MRAGLLAFLQYCDRDLAEPLGELGRFLDELAEADRAGKPGGACADDQDPDLDPLVRRVTRLGDELPTRERGWVIRRGWTWKLQYRLLIARSVIP